MDALHAKEAAQWQYDAFSPDRRWEIYVRIVRHPIVVEINKNVNSKLLFEEIFKHTKPSNLLSQNIESFGLNHEKRMELYDLVYDTIEGLIKPAAAPAAGGRRKSTTRVRVRGRPSTRTTRRATYGARRRATSARSVRARRLSK